MSNTRAARLGMLSAPLEAMLRAAVVFMLLALVAGFLGFGGISSSAAWIAKVAFVVFLVMAAFSFLTGRKTKS